jgi:hypothetical protein
MINPKHIGALVSRHTRLLTNWVPQEAIRSFAVRFASSAGHLTQENCILNKLDNKVAIVSDSGRCFRFLDLPNRTILSSTVSARRVPRKRRDVGGEFCNPRSELMRAGPGFNRSDSTP